jgi:hypothetical protein
MEIGMASRGAEVSPVYLPSRAFYRSAVQIALDFTKLTTTVTLSILAKHFHSNNTNSAI